MKKGSPEQPPENADLVPNGVEDSESENSLTDGVPIDVEHTEEQNLAGVIVPELKKSLVVLICV